MLASGSTLYGDGSDQLPNNQTSQRFTSYDRSTATGLDYAVNRRHHSGQGRFTQVDPPGMGAASLTDPQSLNLYAYCVNDPINHTDPDGLDGGASVVLEIQVVAAVISALRLLFGGGGGNRTQRVPIVKQVTFRETGQISHRSVWTQASVQAGVGR